MRQSYLPLSKLLNFLYQCCVFFMCHVINANEAKFPFLEDFYHSSPWYFAILHNSYGISKNALFFFNPNYLFIFSFLNVSSSNPRHSHECFTISAFLNTVPHCTLDFTSFDYIPRSGVAGPCINYISVS